MRDKAAKAESAAVKERQDAWRQSVDAARKLDTPEFILDDVATLTGLKKEHFRQWLSRDLITLSRRHNPGKGQRRLFSGRDVIMLRAAADLSALGLPIRVANSLTEHIGARAFNLLAGAVQRKNYAILICAVPDDWKFISVYDDGEPPDFDESEIPFAFTVLNVDNLIKDTLNKISKLISDEQATGDEA